MLQIVEEPVHNTMVVKKEKNRWRAANLSYLLLAVAKLECCWWSWHTDGAQKEKNKRAFEQKGCQIDKEVKDKFAC